MPHGLGEVLILASGPGTHESGAGDGESRQIEGAPRELGADFHAYPLPGQELTVVGLCEGVVIPAETVWVSQLPTRDQRSYGQCEERASAILTEPARYEAVRDEVVQAGVAWRSAIRLRDGAVDVAWKTEGADQP